MRVGVGLPNGIPGTDGKALLDWARRAEGGPFTSLGVIDRIRYDSFDPMTALAAAAAATERIGLVTMIVIAPLRNAAVLAKEAATVQALSGGRLVLGLGVGARSDDYEAAGLSRDGRGERFTEQLRLLRDYWEDPGRGPRLDDSTTPPILVGGQSDPAAARLARLADGYVHNGGPPRTFARAVERVRAAWRDQGRPGEPRLWSQAYFALGEAAERGLAYMRDYYAFTGPFADKIAAGLLTTPQGVVQYLRDYRELGCEEMVLLPAVADPDQMDRLADVLRSAE